MDTKEISSLSMEPWDEGTVLATLFEIPIEEYPDFEYREAEFNLEPVYPETLDGKKIGTAAILCTRFSDQGYEQKYCRNFVDLSEQAAGTGAQAKPRKVDCGCVKCRLETFGIDRIWRDDILPCRTYLRHCVLSAQGLGDHAYNDFLDTTYLADRTTTIRQHLSSNPDIMEELPPPALRERYCG
ncbi:hypothetical protein CYMTET_29627 [Cymbomonas tetramitiformis]|uniref:Uncharacterized protein n=1 Tax=Cymbomonas tetramitiformis TaxID=36881 RepID=A0AAE0FL14_9CHLO|nr:hypothetical protein CYMTET_29627 [Cymbomonas tetramitiformis]|eukprot:gene25115-30650_t